MGRAPNQAFQGDQRSIVVFCIGLLPAIVFVSWCCAYSVQQSDGGLSSWGVAIAAVLGFLAGMAVTIAGKWLQMRWASPIPGQAPVYLIFPLGWIGFDSFMRAQYEKATTTDWLGKIFAKGGPGYSQTFGGQRFGLPGHGFATSLAMLAGVLYLIGGSTHKHLLHQPDPRISILGLPTVFLVILAIMLMSWTNGGLAFFFDRYRIPVIVPLVLVAGAFSVFVDTDHIFQLDKQEREAFPTARSVLEKAPDRLILVAAAGGGIQASAWTARVLASLREENPEFAGAVKFISGVSGGSVGALHYLTTYGLANEGPVTPGQAIDRSMEDSLEGIAWGLTHPDFWRMTFPWMDRDVDRGWALQRAIAKQSGTSGLRLSDLATQVSKCLLPAFAINATTVETGGPLVFSSAKFGGAAADRAGIRDFREVFGASDIDVATAVRLSASFPYVSPAARSWIYDPKIHFVDGGYYDTCGMVTTMAWLQDALDQGAGPALAQKRILILAIEPFPASARDSAERQAGESHDWPYQLVAPLLALYDARDHGQSYRNNVEPVVLPKAMTNISLATVKFQYVAAGTDCETAPPLSWHLSGKEKSCLKSAYSNSKQDAAKLCVREFLKSGSPTSCPWN